MASALSDASRRYLQASSRGTNPSNSCPQCQRSAKQSDLSSPEVGMKEIERDRFREADFWFFETLFDKRRSIPDPARREAMQQAARKR